MKFTEASVFKLHLGSSSTGVCSRGGKRISEKQIAIHILIPDAKTGSPLFKGHLLVLIRVAFLEKAGCAVLHWHQRDPKRCQLRVGEQPVRGVLVQLSKLPVHWVNIHVVVLLEVLCEQLNRVITSMKTPLILKDFLHSVSLFGSEEARCHGVVLIELQEHIFQPIPHPKRELD